MHFKHIWHASLHVARCKPMATSPFSPSRRTLQTLQRVDTVQSSVLQRDKQLVFWREIEAEKRRLVGLTKRVSKAFALAIFF